MPDISELLIASTSVTAEELYNQSIFDPTVDDTFEILNGGLDAENYGGGNKTVPAYACQFGSFAAGSYIGFDRDEFLYAEQIANDRNKNTRIISAGLSRDVWIPFDAKFVMFGMQAFFKQDATSFLATHGSASGPAHNEYWEYKIEFGNVALPSLFGVIPTSKQTTHGTGNSEFDVDEVAIWPEGPNTTVGTDRSYSTEERWRYVSKIGAKKNVSKGYHSVKTSFFGGMAKNNPLGSKVIVPSGGVWILAIR